MVIGREGEGEREEERWRKGETDRGRVVIQGWGGWGGVETERKKGREIEKERLGERDSENETIKR